MNSIDDFAALVSDGLGLQITAADLGRGFDQLPGWDSVHLLWLLTALESATGRRMSLPALMEATSLEQVYRLAAAA